VLRPDAGDGQMLEVSSSHTTHHSRLDSSGRAISSSQRRLPDNTQHSQQTFMPLAEFEPTIPAGERPQIYAVDRAVTDAGWHMGMSYFVTYKRCCCLNNISNIQWIFQLSPLFKNKQNVSAATFLRWFLLKTEEGSFRNVVFFNIEWQWKKS